MALPPPIIPETEDSTSSPLSETSSGYISTSISTATLSDVYTLSWDIPPSSGSKADIFEAVPDEEEEDKLTYLTDQPGPREVLLVFDNKAAVERTDSAPTKPDSTPSNLNQIQQEATLSPSVQSNDPEEPNSEELSKTEHKQDSPLEHVGSEQADSLEPIKDSLLVQENDTKQTDVSQNDPTEPETPQTEELQLAATDKTESRPSAQEAQSETIMPQLKQPKQDQETLDTAQVPDSKVLLPTPDSSGDPVLQGLPKKLAASQVSNPNGTSTLTLSSTTDETEEEVPDNTSTKATKGPEPSLSSGEPSKPNASVANPFKIQKVKSSGLQSFQRILGKEDEKSSQVDRASSLGSGLNLTVPLESLEIISDSEEGDAATTVVPDWLKEGEFVTVGTNKCGIVRFVGPTDFAEGTWVGVELEVPAGEKRKTQSCCFLMYFLASSIATQNFEPACLSLSFFRKK